MANKTLIAVAVASAMSLIPQANAASAPELDWITEGGTRGGRTAGPRNLSPDGRFLVFSTHSALLPVDTNGQEDVYLLDRTDGYLELISRASSGELGNSYSGTGSVSDDGSRVAFWSGASNLVPGDTNGQWDVFVRDRISQTTVRVSLASDGSEGIVEKDNLGSGDASISGDGTRVAFWSDNPGFVPHDYNNDMDVFVYDLNTSETILVSAGRFGYPGMIFGSHSPNISRDGRWVTFDSWSSDLVEGDTNHWADVFIRDLETSTTMRVSVTDDGSEIPYGGLMSAPSADGRYVVFVSNGDLIARDVNNEFDVYVWDRLTGKQEIVTVSGIGAPSLAALGAMGVSISDDGRYIAYAWVSAPITITASTSSMVVPPMHVYVRDRLLGTTSLVSSTQDGDPGNAGSYLPSISNDGSLIAFSSYADFDPDDRNGYTDVYLKNRGDVSCDNGSRAEGQLSSKIQTIDHDKACEIGGIGG